MERSVSQRCALHTQRIQNKPFFSQPLQFLWIVDDKKKYRRTLMVLPSSFCSFFSFSVHLLIMISFHFLMFVFWFHIFSDEICMFAVTVRHVSFFRHNFVSRLSAFQLQRFDIIVKTAWIFHLCCVDIGALLLLFFFWYCRLFDLRPHIYCIQLVNVYVVSKSTYLISSLIWC